MFANLRLLLMQIKCEYCGKPLSQTEEWRLGKTSLCENCFKFIIGADSPAVSSAHSKALSSANSSALSERKRCIFTMHFPKERGSLSPALSLGDSPHIPLNVLLDVLHFYRRVKK